MLKPEQQATHYIPSGLGGIFHVVILKETNTHCLVMIMAKGSDFHHKTYRVKKSDVHPLEEKSKEIQK